MPKRLTGHIRFQVATEKSDSDERHFFFKSNRTCGAN